MGINLPNSFVSDVTMFFLGAIIGTILHYVISYITDKYDNLENKHLLFIGISQLLLIAFITRLLTRTLNMQGLFILGIVSSQELVIAKLYPRNKKQKI